MTNFYQQASFRGVKFLVETAVDEGGPRNIIHEFPGRDTAYAEPSGRFVNRIQIEAHLIGPNCLRELSDLRAALDAEGPGELVHPHPDVGRKQVVIDGTYRIQRNTHELNFVRISIQFCETGAQALITRPDTVARLAAAIKVAQPPSTAGFSVKGPDFLTAAATAILAGPLGLTTQLDKVNNRIHAAFGLIDDVAHTITAFSNEVTDLLNTPSELFLAVQNVINAVLGAVTAAGFDVNRGDAQRNRFRVSAVLGYAQALGTFGDGLATVPQTTGTRKQQAANQAALVDVVEMSAVVGSISSLSSIPLDNSDQAGDAYNAIGDLSRRIEDRGTLDDGATQNLRDVRAAFHAFLRETVSDLPELGRYTPPVWVPAVVLAYRLYGDSSRDADIIERNPSIEHPGFVAGGVELAVAQA